MELVASSVLLAMQDYTDVKTVKLVNAQIVVQAPRNIVNACNRFY